MQDAWQRVAEDYAPFDVDVTTEDPGAAAIDRTGPGDSALRHEGFDHARHGRRGVVQLWRYRVRRRVRSPHGPPDIPTGARVRRRREEHRRDRLARGRSHPRLESRRDDGRRGVLRGPGQLGADHGSRILAADHAVEQRGVRSCEQFRRRPGGDAVARGVAEADDYPDTRSAAVSLGSGLSLSATGLIGRSTDVDWFSFSGAGPTTLAVSPAAISPDLDLRLDVYDSSGTVIASADPPASTVTADVAAGLGGSISIDLGTAGTLLRPGRRRRLRRPVDDGVLRLREPRAVQPHRHNRLEHTSEHEPAADQRAGGARSDPHDEQRLVDEQPHGLHATSGGGATRPARVARTSPARPHSRTCSPRTTSGRPFGRRWMPRTPAARRRPTSAQTTVVQAPPTTPGAPTGVSATGGNGLAQVSFAPPSSNGGAAITSYTATASPGGAQRAGRAARSRSPA